MWLIDRDTDGIDASRILLPAPLQQALVRWYVGGGTHHDEQAGITLVQQARIGHKWIACDCLDQGARPPILTPAFLSEADTYYLRRLTSSKRPEHRSDCPFLRNQVTLRIIEARLRMTPADPPSGFFEVLRPAPERLAQAPDDDTNDDRHRHRHRHASTPRLARLLWRLMDAGGASLVAPLRYGDEWSIRAAFANLGAAAAKTEIAPRFELARAFWTNPRALQSKATYAQLRELAKHWPKDHAPQGFLLLYVPHFKGHEITLPDGTTIGIANRIQSPSVRGNHIPGPYLVLVVIGEYPESRGYAPLRAYAQPIFNGCRFVPVESDFERKTMRCLLDCQKILHVHGVDAAIGKPLFDTMTRLGPCRPDFMVEARSRTTGEVRTLVIEAMSFDTDDYHAAKAVTHPRMQLLGDLLTFTPHEVDGNEAQAKVLAALDI
ncbi:hypothetical protein [uncultured Sphingomonas sp.]|uniref:hypothetical protein n=1 Tax=uncultured Sphingomonas sp. TaxID=158754 RepID=UPI0035CB6A04